jgi:Ser/Thr protein kinase RdoA (MazF antagonist)
VIPEPQAIAEEVARAHDPGAIDRWAPIRSGTDDVFGLDTATGPYVLKVYRCGWRSEPEIRWEQALIRHEASGGARVAEPVTRRGGTDVLRIDAPEGPRPAALFTRAPEGPARRPFSRELFRAYGVATGELRRAAAGFRSHRGSGARVAPLLIRGGRQVN